MKMARHQYRAVMAWQMAYQQYQRVSIIVAGRKWRYGERRCGGISNSQPRAM